MSLLLKESEEARIDFIAALLQVSFNVSLRTASETLLILYDQYTEMIRKNPELEKKFGV